MFFIQQAVRDQPSRPVGELAPAANRSPTGVELADPDGGSRCESPVPETSLGPFPGLCPSLGCLSSSLSFFLILAILVAFGHPKKTDLSLWLLLVVGWCLLFVGLGLAVLLVRFTLGSSLPFGLSLTLRFTFTFRVGSIGVGPAVLGEVSYLLTNVAGPRLLLCCSSFVLPLSFAFAFDRVQLHWHRTRVLGESSPILSVSDHLAPKRVVGRKFVSLDKLSSKWLCSDSGAKPNRDTIFCCSFKDSQSFLSAYLRCISSHRSMAGMSSCTSFTGWVDIKVSQRMLATMSVGSRRYAASGTYPDRSPQRSSW